MAKRAVAENITIEIPRTLPKVFHAQVSEAIEAHLNAVTLLTAVLDAAEADADSEPSLGASEPFHFYGTQDTQWRHPKRARMDLEDEDDGLEGGGDDELSGDEEEPSLAHTNDMNQSLAHRNTGYLGVYNLHEADAEAEHDGREPSLGSPAAAMHDQTGWAAGERDDREGDEHDGCEPEDYD